MAATPRAVLWDVGNVIVRWDPRTLYSKIFPIATERDAFLRDVCTGAWNLQHDAGRPMAEGIAELTARHPHHREAIGRGESVRRIRDSVRPRPSRHRQEVGAPIRPYRRRSGLETDRLLHAIQDRLPDD